MEEWRREEGRGKSEEETGRVESEEETGKLGETGEWERNLETKTVALRTARPGNGWTRACQGRGRGI